MELESRIWALIGPSLEASGYELVRIAMQGSQRRTLQVMAERQDRQPMTVDDCASISRAISAILDVEDPIDGAYTLEVSSPGIDRPLVKPQDFSRFAGYLANVETVRPIEGRKRFKGRLKGLDDSGRVIVVADGVDGAAGDIAIDPSDIGRAKLVLTDDLLADSLKHNNH
jgi:ribosome maturation factor RimP